MDGRRRRQSRRPEARGWLRSGGDGRAGPEMLIPSRSSGGGGPSWPDRDGVWRRAAADMGRRCSACLRLGSEGKRRRRSWGSRCPPWLGLWRCGEGCPAMAGVRERRLWRMAALGCREGGCGARAGDVVRRSGAGALYRRERRLGFAGMLRRPATGLMAVGLAWLCAGVNARRGDTTLRPGGDRRRRRCAEVAGAVRRQRRSASVVACAVASRRAMRARAGKGG